VQQNELLDPPLVLGVLVSTLPVRVLEVSRSGCLLQTRSNVGEGMSGELSLDAGGHGCVDHVKVMRCTSNDEDGGTYSIGVEFSSPRREVSASVWPAAPKVSELFVQDRSSEASREEPDDHGQAPGDATKRRITH
jgi:hypothetical protein